MRATYARPGQTMQGQGKLCGQTMQGQGKLRANYAMPGQTMQGQGKLCKARANYAGKLCRYDEKGRKVQWKINNDLNIF